MENYSSSEIFADKPVVYGSFGQRLVAAIIDGVILAIANGIINRLMGHSVTYNMYEGGSTWYTHYYSSPGGLINLVINWLYFALQESSPYQATLGKRAMGLVVTSTSGQRISFMNATGRYFGKIISTIIIFIGYFMMLWDDKNQTLHDKMASTLVVKKQL